MQHQMLCSGVSREMSGSTQLIRRIRPRRALRPIERAVDQRDRSCVERCLRSRVRFCRGEEATERIRHYSGAGITDHNRFTSCGHLRNWEKLTRRKNNTDRIFRVVLILHGGVLCVLPPGGRAQPEHKGPSTRTHRQRWGRLLGRLYKKA